MTTKTQGASRGVNAHGSTTTLAQSATSQPPTNTPAAPAIAGDSPPTVVTVPAPKTEDLDPPPSEPAASAQVTDAPHDHDVIQRGTLVWQDVMLHVVTLRNGMIVAGGATYSGDQEPQGNERREWKERARRKTDELLATLLNVE